jgi:hypothetical protein
MVAGDAARQFLYPGIFLGHFLGISQVEHGGAAARAVLLFIIGAQNVVPHVIGDAEIAVFIDIVMFVVALLHVLHPLPLWLEGQMLDAMHEFIIAGGQDADRKGQRGPADAVAIFGNQRANRGRRDKDRRHSRVQCAEQNLQMVGVLMVVIVDALPRAGQQLEFIRPLTMQDILVQQVPHQRIDRRRRRHDGHRAPQARRVPRENDKARRRQRQIGHDRVMLEIGKHQIAQGHAVQIMRSLPERQLGFINGGVVGGHLVVSLKVLAHI